MYTQYASLEAFSAGTRSTKIAQIVFRARTNTSYRGIPFLKKSGRLPSEKPLTASSRPPHVLVFYKMTTKLLQLTPSRHKFDVIASVPTLSLAPNWTLPLAPPAHVHHRLPGVPPLPALLRRSCVPRTFPSFRAPTHSTQAPLLLFLRLPCPLCPQPPCLLPPGHRSHPPRLYRYRRQGPRRSGRPKARSPSARPLGAPWVGSRTVLGASSEQLECSSRQYGRRR